MREEAGCKGVGKARKADRQMSKPVCQKKITEV